MACRGLTVKESGGVVTISFKNTSRYALDISPQELPLLATQL
jgi:hypothetical protein